MATVNILQPAFSITWAEDGTVEAIDEAQWKAGWAYIGTIPPSVEQFNKVHQIHDQKSNWLYGRVGSLRGANVITTSQALGAELLGSQLVLGASGAATSFALPSTVDLLPGSKVSAYAVAGSTVNITSPSSNIFGSNVVGGGVNSMRLAAGSASDFVWTGAFWLAINGSGSMAPTSFGYEISAGGIIKQWAGDILLSVQGSLVTFPIAFPQECFGVFLSSPNGGTPLAVSSGAPTLTNFRAWAGAVPCQLGYIAYGK